MSSTIEQSAAVEPFEGGHWGQAFRLSNLAGRTGYRKFVQDGLKEGHREDYYELADERFLGGEEFTEALKKKSNEEPIRKPKQKLIDAFRSAARAADVNPAVLSSADRGWAVSRPGCLLRAIRIW